jgi:hypothetical protein
MTTMARTNPPMMRRVVVSPRVSCFFHQILWARKRKPPMFV